MNIDGCCSRRRFLRFAMVGGVAVPVYASTVLGNVAAQANEKLEWDAKKVAFKNSKTADKFLFRPYRKGYDYIKIDA